MDEIPSSDARQNLPELINEVVYQKKRVVLTRRGKKVAALIPLEDLKTLEMLEDMAGKAALNK